MSENDTQFDNIFMTVIQNKKSIDGFFESVYGFLRRNTDFFTDQSRAEKVITEQCKKQFELYLKSQKDKESKEKEKKEREEAKKIQKEKELKLKQEKDELEKQKKQAEVEKKVEPVVAAATVPATETAVEKVEKKADGAVEEEEDNSPAPYGNGGKNEKYIWTQTLNELHMYIPVSDSVKSKFVKIDFSIKHLKVVIEGKTLIDQDFPENINAEDCLWTLEDGDIQDYKGRLIHLSIEKWKNQMHWWECALIGDDKINTKKIQPESSKLSDLDGETRSTVEKMMFDMRQKQAGLPSSDEMKKQDMMSNFMKTHPEMDFSKCKFN